MPKPTQARNPFLRMWPLRAESTNNYKKIDGCQEHIVLAIPRKAFTPTAVSFTNFDQSTQEGKKYNLLFQLFLYAANKIPEIHKEKLKADQKEKDPDKKLPEPKGPLVYARLETIFDKNLDDPKVVQYRLHIYMMFTPHITFGECLEYVLRENAEIHARLENPNTISSGKTSGSHLPGTKDWKNRLYFHEAFRCIRSKEDWIKLCDFYVGKTRFSVQEESIMNCKLQEESNPANPRKIFSIGDAIEKTPASLVHPGYLDPVIYWYKDQEGSRQEVCGWPEINQKFHLIKIQAGEMSPAVVCYRWLPEYQSKKLPILMEHIRSMFPGINERWERHAKKVNEEGRADGYLGDVFSLPPPIQAKVDDFRTNASIRNDPVEGEKPYFDDEEEMDMDYLDVATEILNNRVVQYQLTSDFKMLRDENQHALEKIKKIGDSEDYAKAYENFEREAFEQFEGRCWTPDADISDIGHIIRNWGRDPKNSNFNVKHEKIDPSLSVFGNMVIRRTMMFDNYFFVSTSHKALLMMIYARLDTYRQSLDLHFNNYLGGPAGKSKSFALGKMEEASIPGTVQTITYQTPKADAIDSDRNDVITIMHEMPADMMQVKTVGGSESSQTSSFKERLTSLKVKAKVYYQDEATGIRDQRTTESECIGTWFVASNEDVGKIDDALVTRFHITQYADVFRELRDLASLMGAHKNMSDAEKQKYKDFIQELRVEQYRYFLVEKLIMTRALPEFNTKNSDSYFSKLWSQTTEDGYNVHSRTIERMQIMTRILSICYGLECLYNVPTGPFYGKKFEISQLKEMKNYLVPTEEIMLFVVGLFKEQVHTPGEDEVLAAIRTIHESSNSGRRWREVFDDSQESPQTLSPAPAPAQNQGSDAGSQDIMRAALVNSLPADPNMVQTTPKPIAERKKLDFNYIQIRKSVTAVCGDIHRAMDLFAFKLSALQIKDILMKLKERMITTYPYERANIADKAPTEMTNEKKIRLPGVMVDSEGVYILYHLLAKSGKPKMRGSKSEDGSDADSVIPGLLEVEDVMTSYVKNLWYDKTIESKVVYGDTIEGHPQLFKILHVKPNPNKKYVVYNVLYANDATKRFLYGHDEKVLGDAERRGKQMEIYRTDLDTDSLFDQFLKLEYDDIDAAIQKYHPIMISAKENAWLAATNGVDEHGKIKNVVNYPHDIIKEHIKSKRTFDLAFKDNQHDYEEKHSEYFNTNRKRPRTSKRSKTQEGQDQTKDTTGFKITEIMQTVKRVDGVVLVDVTVQATVTLPSEASRDPDAPLRLVPMEIVAPPEEEYNPLLTEQPSQTQEQLQDETSQSPNDDLWDQEAETKVVQTNPGIQIIEGKQLVMRIQGQGLPQF